MVWPVTRYLCDTNAWIAMAVQHHVHQERATAWFDTVEDRRALFCRSTQQSVLRLLTARVVFAPYGGSPLTGEQAWDTYERLVTDGRVDFELHEPPGLEGLWRRFTSRALASPKLWMDAYLAAFAVAGGLSFVTTDSGFRQFPGLTLVLLGE